jgi:hypothetical protein
MKPRLSALAKHASARNKGVLAMNGLLSTAGKPGPMNYA